MTSEHQLLAALAAGGRRVSLEELGLWRRNGLLPPLASNGVRIAGRSYYWQEPDILPRAALIHDALHRHGRNEIATIQLWLHGFEVPLPRLRRAWLHRNRQDKPVRIGPANGVSRPAGRTLPELLLSATLQAAASIECPPGIAIPVLKRAAAALGYAPGGGETRTYWQAAMALLLALDASDAVSSASDEEMLTAQHHLQVALRFLSGYCQEENPATVAEALGPGLFLFILTLLRSGQHAVVQAVMDRIAAIRATAPRQAANQDGAAEIFMSASP